MDDHDSADDELLRKLGALAAEQEREAPETEAFLAASRPLDAVAQSRITSAISAHLGSTRRATRRRARVGAGVAVSGLALAAGVALYVRASGSEALPLYGLHSSGASSLRSPASPSVQEQPCVLHASTRGSFELLARPRDAVSGTVAARVFIVRGGELQPWAGTLEVSPQGSVRVLDENPKLSGATEIRIVVGWPDRLEPGDALELARSGSASGRGWQLLRCAIDGS